MIEIFTSKAAIAACVVGLISLLLTSSQFQPESSPIVTVENGEVQGSIAYSRSGEKYFEYLGIPYALPPIKSLRYEAPVPYNKRWTGVRQVTKQPPRCLQFDADIRGKVQGVEDCLFLSVFSRDVKPKTKKPVMVFIHGGGFMSGGANMYRPDFFLDEDVVLVTLNYRLGPLGFLNTGDDGIIRGNMGLKDQNMALRWVQKNIGKFGGDPNRVTIFGESAGAASVQFHIISPASQGLFQKAIIQSGAVTCPWSLMKNPEEMANDYIRLTGCPMENRTEMVACLKEINAEELVKLQGNLIHPIFRFLYFVPSKEPVQTPDTFLSENPRKILESGQFSKIPLLIGVCSGEGALRTARVEKIPELITEIDTKWTELAPRMLSYEEESTFHKKEVSDQVREFYFGDSSFMSHMHEFRKNFSKMSSDRDFFEPIRQAAKLHAKYGSPTYLYYYDYDSALLPSMYTVFRAVRYDDWLPAELKLAWAILVDLIKENVLETESPRDFGATHADDLFQLWNMEGITGFLSGRDSDFSKKFVKAFVDFARDERSLQFAGINWPSINSQDSEKPGSVTSHPLQYMLLNNNPRVIDEPFADRMAFWESLRIRDSR